MPNSLIWCVLLSPIPLIGAAWYVHLTNARHRMPRAIRWAMLILSASYLLILLELAMPEFIGDHFGDRRAYTILVNLALAPGVLVVGLISRSKVGMIVALSAVVVGLGWLYMAAIGTAV